MKAFKKAVPVMGKEHFVRFAGVVGDFNPVHYDLEFAKRFNMPAVVGQGPLSVTLALDALISENGADAIAGISARVAAPMFPDMALTAEADGEGNITLSDGETTVLKAKAEAR